MEYDTIVAISTPIGEGGISVIRLSGEEAIKIADKVYKGKQKISQVNSHTIHYGFIIDSNGEIVDEILLTVMKAPRSFTREDVVEINCHGGIIAAKRVLDLVIDNGARHAEPGEFTKRAFINGRIDLSQAEAIIDLIRSKTDKAMKVAMKQVEGRLSNEIKQIRREILEILAHIEVTIDYPEHDVEDVTQHFLSTKLHTIAKQINKLLEGSSQGKILREGVSTVIIGRPNVGKSSLLNTLIHENKAIVTEIPGTTRDVIEEYISIKGIPLKLIDTAGIRETEDIVEKIGVERSTKAIEDADLVLLVFNYNDTLTEEDLKLIDLVKNQNVIVVINKTDLERKIDEDVIKQRLLKAEYIYTSIKDEKGIDDLEQAIADLFFKGNIKSDDTTFVSNTRHITLLRQSKKSIDDAIASLEEYLPIDMLAIDIKNTWDYLGEIIGDAVSEDLTDQIFSQFCVGK